MRIQNAWGLLFLVGLAMDGLAAGSFGEPLQSSSHEKSSSTVPGEDMLGLEKILDTITKNLMLRYNLSEDQTTFTRDLLGTRVRKFLQEHQREAWPILRELMHYQMTGETPDAAAAKRIAEAAVPLFEKAKQAIIEGNYAWREILTEEQKVKHDYDLKQMTESQFPFVDGRFKEWREGRPESGNLFPPAPKTKDVNEPPTPPKPSPSSSPLQQDTANKDRFTAFTDEFIKACQLDEGQTATVRSVLVEILARFEVYSNQSKVERQKLTAEIRRAIIEGDVRKQRELEEQEKALMEPIEVLFEELVLRLEAQLRAEQREVYLKTLGRNRASTPGQKAGAVEKVAAPAKPVEGEKNTPPAEAGNDSKGDSAGKAGGGKKKRKKD